MQMKIHFYKNSRFDNSQANFLIEKMIEDGANIIDIGAVSSQTWKYCS
jgi:dihydropteroate synthase